MVDCFPYFLCYWSNTLTKKLSRLKWIQGRKFKITGKYIFCLLLHQFETYIKELNFMDQIAKVIGIDATNAAYKGFFKHYLKHFTLHFFLGVGWVLTMHSLFTESSTCSPCARSSFSVYLKLGQKIVYLGW